MKSCQQCRKAKRRCIRSKTDILASCGRCLRHHLACSNAQPASSRRKFQLAPRSQPPDPDRPQLPHSLPPPNAIDNFLADEQRAAALVDNYLTKIHDRPHSIFHAPTLWSDIRRRCVPRGLLLALCATGAHLSSEATVRSLIPILTAECKRLLRDDLDNVCLENIQTCILVANLYTADANHSSGFLFFRMAITMAQLMDIPAGNFTDDVVTTEVKIRVWWALFMADIWCSSSLGLAPQMNGFPRPARLPMEEQLFYSLTPDQTSSVLQSCQKPGLWAHMITLVELFGPIQDLNRRVVQSKTLDDTEIEDSTDCLAQQLNNWERELPSDMNPTESNIIEHSHRGTGGAFFALHLGFHHYATLLYYQYLDTQFTLTARSRHFAALCKHHALQYSHLLARGRRQPGCETLYPTVGHMTTVSSSVLVHTLLFGTEEELTQSRQCLNANFEALLELQQYWSSVRSMINRLMNFQNTCLLLTHRHTHRLDRWMTRFLFEYSLPLDEKTVNHPHSASEMEIISTQAQAFAEQGRLTTFGYPQEPSSASLQTLISGGSIGRL